MPKPLNQILNNNSHFSDIDPKNILNILTKLYKIPKGSFSNNKIIYILVHKHIQNIKYINNNN